MKQAEDLAAGAAGAVEQAEDLAAGAAAEVVEQAEDLTAGAAAEAAKRVEDLAGGAAAEVAKQVEDLAAGAAADAVADTAGEAVQTAEDAAADLAGIAEEQGKVLLGGALFPEMTENDWETLRENGKELGSGNRIFSDFERLSRGAPDSVVTALLNRQFQFRKTITEEYLRARKIPLRLYAWEDLSFC